MIPGEKRGQNQETAPILQATGNRQVTIHVG